MADALVKVRLAHAVKIGTRWLPPGEHDVTPEDKAVLIACGVLVEATPEAVTPQGKLITVTEEQFAQAVAAQAKALAEAVSNAAVEAACAEIIADRDKAVEGVENLNRRVEALEAELEAERVSHDETRQQLAEATKAPDHTNTPPSETPAETAPKKKGAAGTTKG
ncbi:hypothetical protein GCM10007291_50450 [Gemmobacter nanjingensis]|uniref:Uncharacterized protein n=1 Tax=Gemmobacter nanjingensis TaxID=488454 RepID=A0ABQ3FUL2_9RHOB|nr:hypothetical protein [Gemmobacter nanjingensis]GHC42697.1 hypothetical protein GCM10007291_50450 [Gemmobacter nanjingensis]